MSGFPKILKIFTIFILTLLVLQIFSLLLQARTKGVVKNIESQNLPAFSIYGSTLSYDITGSGEYIQVTIKDPVGNIYRNKDSSKNKPLYIFPEGSLWVGNLDFDPDIEIFTFTNRVFTTHRASFILNVSPDGSVSESRNVALLALAWLIALSSSWLIWFLIIPIGIILLFLYFLSNLKRRIKI